ncbi:hypothetical protein G9C85_11095 [Halorubellus sp. JP-L1]|uniref:DUF7114 family protein n=1 Tax=Halorubellus sp. JP-L1 TaxID=2715753 RepID=UPI00140B4262|nr:hypothetical protein [Halorubellus sp. JP-L1]NHN42168.1 hypothetical protein [Halorubellus sp. JP-L1]
MDEAATCRSAAVDAVEDVYPARLRDDIVAHVDAGSLAPGTLALRCARAVDDAVDDDAIGSRAAGVQLIYDGLRLTRTLAHTEPWTEVDDQTQPNLDILAADVLVARGFYLLARTDAAGRAVEVVQTFGREQTERRDAAADPTRDPADHDRTLERDVLDLAVLAGTTAAGGTPTPELYAYVADCNDHVTDDGFPNELDFLPTVAGLRGTIPPEEPTADDGVPQSAGDS